MKQILIASILLVGCGVNRAPQYQPAQPVIYTNHIPIGSTIQYRVTTSNQEPIFALEYWDEQSNSIHLRKVASGWTYSFTTAKDRQPIILGCLVGRNDTTTVTGQIWVNGVLAKNATGQQVNLSLPR
jgi:hypothetical protein